LWQFNPFGQFIPKMPPSTFFFKKKNPKKQKMGWPATPAYIYIFFWNFFCLEKKSTGGILGINRPKWIKLPQFESLGG
jgi:hypothetical protein